VVPTPTVVPVDDSYKRLASPIVRPLISWDRARRRVTDPPLMLLTGTGAEDSARHGPILYHNDWITMLVSGGIFGFLAYLLLVVFLGSISWVLALPFFLPGMVNTFLISPQFVVLISILAGIVMRKKIEERRERNRSLDVVYVAVDWGLSIDNSPVLRSQVVGAGTALSNGGYRVGLIANVEDQTSSSLNSSSQHFDEIRTVRTASLPMMLIASAWKLNRLNRHRSIRSLYVRGVWGAVVAHLAFPFFNGPELIYDFRGDIVAEARSTGTSGVRLWALRLLTQLSIRSASKNMSVSSTGARKLEQSYGVRTVSVIPSSANYQQFQEARKSRAEVRQKLGFSEDDVVFVYAGGLARYQMIPEMLAMWAELERPGARFLLLTSSQPGHNIDGAELTSMLPTGTIMRTLDPDDVPAYLAASDIGFLLRQPAPLNTVASPVKFAEYLAAGLAVVTSPGLGDTPDQVEKSDVGIVVSPTPSIEELNTLREFLVEFPERRHQIRERALTLARNRYDWGAHLGIWQRIIFDDANASNEDELLIEE
jgi:glycosyltransferase involved in cell wall biosynthesis